MTLIFRRTAISALILAASSGPALAFEPADIRLGDMTLTPSLRLSEAYDDNFRATRDGESSWITTIEPTFVLGAQDRLNTYELSYSFNTQLFHSSHRDDHTDHHLSADAHMEFDSRNRLDLSAGYDKVEETADTTEPTENDKYHNADIGAIYGFGAESARMQLELGARHEHRRYDNSGDLNADRDHDTDTLTGTAYIRLAPKTRALFEAEASDFRYRTNHSLDSISLAYLAGVTWDATARTSGSLKVGRERKNFDATTDIRGRRLNDPSENVWELGVTWKPLTYSRVELSTSQQIEEGSDRENFIRTRRTALDWNHHWKTYVSTELSLWHTDERYDNAIERHDKTDGAGVALNYDLRRWLSVGLGYQYTDRSSTLAEKTYDRNLYQATVKVSL